MHGKPLIKKYKYSGFIRSLDSHILMSKAELEGKLLDSQLTTNVNTQNTNRANKVLLACTTVFAFFALLVSFLSYNLALKQDKRECSKQNIEQQPLKLKQQLQAEQSENAILNHKIDSLLHQGKTSK